MSEAIFPLSDDQKAVLLRSLQSLYSTSGQLHQFVEQNLLTTEMAAMLPSLLESYYSEVAKALGYQSQLLKEKEERHAKIKEANLKIRALEEKLGSSRSVDGLKEQLEHLTKQVKTWWGTEGFHHISEMTFTAYGGLDVAFSFMLDHFGRYTKTPVTDKKNKKTHIESLRAKGFVFADFEEYQSERLQLIDNEENRKLLLAMLRKRFPSIEVRRWDNESSFSDSDIFTIRRVEATIDELTDI